MLTFTTECSGDGEASDPFSATPLDQVKERLSPLKLPTSISNRCPHRNMREKNTYAFSSAEAVGSLPLSVQGWRLNGSLQTAFLSLLRLERRRSQVSSMVLNRSFWSMRLPRPPSSRIQPRVSGSKSTGIGDNCWSRACGRMMVRWTPMVGVLPRRRRGTERGI